jgi:hypothetical protein
MTVIICPLCQTPVRNYLDLDSYTVTDDYRCAGPNNDKPSHYYRITSNGVLPISYLKVGPYLLQWMEKDKEMNVYNDDSLGYNRRISGLDYQRTNVTKEDFISLALRLQSLLAFS